MLKSVKYSIVLCCCLFLFLNTKAKNDSKSAKITHMELGYPAPAIPFYHFIAHVELSDSCFVEVETMVDEKMIRTTQIHSPDQMGPLNQPELSMRPPSAKTVAYNNKLYKSFYLVGRVRWEPGESYTIGLNIRQKEAVQRSDEDIIITLSEELSAPDEAQVFDRNWKDYKSIVVSETAGHDRKNEPVDVLLAFYPDESQQLKREVRVLSVDAETHELKEVVSQVYDVREYLKEDDLAPDDEGQPTREVPLWLPTRTARVAFLADVPAHTSKVFLIFYNNADAPMKYYKTDLQVQGEEPGLQINNDWINASLHENSGHLEEIRLQHRPNNPLFHRLETNGAIHWNPGIYVPPEPWSHTSDWLTPNHKSVIGPVITKTEVWAPMRKVPEVDASVRYEFFPGVPYFFSSTTMRVKKDVQALAFRNAEIVFKRELMTHAAWYDAIRDTIMVYNVSDMPDLNDLKLEADLPWITFYNEHTNVGFAGIQLNYANAGIESEPRLLNPFCHVTAGPWIYWARGLSHPYLSANMQQVIPVLKGTFYTEKWAYLMYETDGDMPYKPVLNWKDILSDPLRVRISEKVDDRVAKTLKEVYMDEGKSGWEGRDTGKH